MKYNNFLLVLGVILVGLVIYLMNFNDTPEPVEVVVVEEVLELATIPEPVVIPKAQAVSPIILEPIEVIEPEETQLEETPQVEIVLEEEITAAVAPEVPAIVLPSLNRSDDFVRNELSDLSTGSEILKLLVPEELIRKFVLFTESVSQDFLSSAVPIEPRLGRFDVREGSDNEHFFMTPQSSARFDMLIGTLTEIDTTTTVSLYKRLSPLFQKAYAEMGYPDRNFDDVLLKAIDNVLLAPEAEGSMELIQPSVMYKYADENMEDLDAVDKLVMRLGSENAEKLKQKLRAFRAAL